MDLSAEGSWNELDNILPLVGSQVFHIDIAVIKREPEDYIHSWRSMEYFKLLGQLKTRRKQILDGDDSDVTRNEYKKDLSRLIQAQKDATRRNGIRFKTPNYRPDGILSDREVAELLQPYRQYENSDENYRLSGVSVDDTTSFLERQLERSVPELDESFVANLPGKWKLTSPYAYIGKMKYHSNLASDAVVETVPLTAGGWSVPEDQAELFKKAAYARLLILKTPKAKVSAYREVVDDRGNTIRIYRNPKSTNTRNIAASEQDIKVAAESFALIKDRIGSDKKPVTVSFIASSSIIPGRSKSKSGKSLGFAFAGGGAHVYADRNKNRVGTEVLPTDEYNPQSSWHSYVPKDDDEYLMHTIIHEIGHVHMYKYWGQDNVLDDGRQALENDYKKFGIDRLRANAISRYGRESNVEHFAEAYARYIMTGDATTEFLDLLRSKGLLKSQKDG